MKSIFGIKGFAIDEYAISGNAILGIRDSGKTYAGCEAAEELFDAGIPSICIDPIGKWHSLRVPGAGKGYPFVVAGGRHGDLPLNRKNAGELVRGAMAGGISLVVDLFSRDMTKADWRYIVQQVMEILLYENEDFGMRHVFIEEAGEFVPQRVMDGAVFSAVEKVVRMGGNSKLGCTLIHQRPADLNKSVLDLCANVVLLRQKGKTTLTDLNKWFALIAEDQAKEIGASLPKLKSGDGWAFIHDLPHPKRFQVPRRNSKHPDRREAARQDGKAAAPRAAVPATKFVEAMKAKLAAAEKPKAAPVAVAATALHRGQPVQIVAPADAKAIQRQINAATATGFSQGATAMRALIVGYLEEVYPAAISDACQAMTASQGRMLQKINSLKLPSQPQGSPLAALPAPAPKHSGPAPRAAQPVVPAPNSGHSGLPKGQHIVLVAVAQHPNGCTRQQLTVLTGYKKSSRDTYLQQLAQQGFTTQQGDRIEATQAGHEALGPDFERLPTGARLRAHVLATLPQGQRRVLEVVIEGWDAAVPREEITARTGYLKSSRDTYIQQLAARELVEVSRGGIKASANLF